ncbi:MAG: hypothetical protein AAGI51_02110 [Pseudomonadota bacterium]
MGVFAGIAAKGLGAGVILWALLRLMWNWDDDLLKGAAATLDAEMRAGRPSRETADAAARQLLEATLGPRLPLRDKARRVFWTTLASSVALLALYFMSIPEHAAAILRDGEMIRRLSLQFVLSGLVIVYLSLWIADSVAGLLIPRMARAGPGGAALLIAFDLAAKLIALHAATAATYVGAALLVGSFGGEPALALGAVRPTLALALSFGNLSSVYVYAVLISGYPLFLALLLKLAASGDGVAFLWRRLRPLFGVERTPVRTLAAVLAAFLAGAGVVASLMLTGAADAAAGITSR